MNKILSHTIAALAGICAGAGGMYLFTKKMNKLKIDKKVEEINQFYVKKYVKFEEKEPVLEEKETKNDIKTQVKKDVSSIDGIYENHDKKVPIDYSKMVKNAGNYEKIEAEYTKNLPEFPEFTLRRDLVKWPNYEQVYLTYYERDGLFTYIDDTLAEEYTEDYFGLANLGNFGIVGDASDDGDTIYLRDDNKGIIFEIHYEGLAHYSEVVGYGDGED